MIRIRGGEVVVQERVAVEEDKEVRGLWCMGRVGGQCEGVQGGGGSVNRGVMAWGAAIVGGGQPMFQASG